MNTIKSKRIVFLILSIFFLLVFAGFSKYVKAGYFKSIDFDTTVKIQNKIPARFDEIMADGAVLADPFVSTALVLLVSAIVFVRGRGKRKLLAIGIPLAFVALTLIEIYGKNFVPHPGPPFFMVKHPTTIFPEFTIIQPYSYPSGHTARIAFLAVVLSFLTIKQFIKSPKLNKGLLIGLGLGLYVAFIAISRIYLGHHWLSDILGGVSLGGAFGLLSGVFMF